MPNIWLPGPPTSSGVMNSPVVGMSTNTNPAITPGRLSGQRDPQEGREPARRPRSCAASSRCVSMFSSSDEDRQRHERHPGVEEHEPDGELRVDQPRNAVAVGAQVSCPDARVDDAVVREHDLPGDHAQQVAGEERRQQQQQQRVAATGARRTRGSRPADRRPATAMTETTSVMTIEISNRCAERVRNCPGGGRKSFQIDQRELGRRERQVRPRRRRCRARSGRCGADQHREHDRDGRER